MREQRRLGAIALLICLAALAGCGSGGDSTAPADNATGLSVGDVEREKPGTPQYTALQWWQTVQLNRPELAAGLYAKQPPLPDLAGQFNALEGALAGLPKVEEVRRKGSRAVLLIDWTKRERKPHSLKVQLRLVRVNGKWKLADNRLLNIVLQQQEERRQGAGR